MSTTLFAPSTVVGVFCFFLSITFFAPVVGGMVCFLFTPDAFVVVTAGAEVVVATAVVVVVSDVLATIEASEWSVGAAVVGAAVARASLGTSVLLGSACIFFRMLGRPVSVMLGISFSTSFFV